MGNEGDMAQASDNHSQSLANMACDDDRNRDHGILSTMATLLVTHVHFLTIAMPGSLWQVKQTLGAIPDTRTTSGKLSPVFFMRVLLF